MVTSSVPGLTSSPVGRTVTDAVLGDTVTVLTVVRGYPGTVLVEVKVVAGARFDRGVQPAAFTLVETGGRADPVAAAVPLAGYPPLATVPAGQTATGWLAFAAADPRGLVLRYTRAGLVVIGSGQSVPAASYPIPLPD